MHLFVKINKLILFITFENHLSELIFFFYMKYFSIWPDFFNFLSKIFITWISKLLIMVFFRFRSPLYCIFFLHIDKFNPELEIIFPSHGSVIHSHTLSLAWKDGTLIIEHTAWCHSCSALHIMQHTKCQKMYLLTPLWKGSKFCYNSQTMSYGGFQRVHFKD